MAIIPPFRPKPAPRTATQVRSELARTQTRLSTASASSLLQERQAPGISRALGKMGEIQKLHKQVQTLRKELKSMEGR